MKDFFFYVSTPLRLALSSTFAKEWIFYYFYDSFSFNKWRMNFWLITKYLPCNRCQKEKIERRKFYESKRDLVDEVFEKKLSNQLAFSCVIKDNVNHFSLYIIKRERDKQTKDCLKFCTILIQWRHDEKC